MNELKRRATNRERVLARLQQGPASTTDLIMVGGTEVPRRVRELRTAGYSINVAHISGGLWMYTLNG